MSIRIYIPTPFEESVKKVCEAHGKSATQLVIECLIEKGATKANDNTNPTPNSR